MQGLTLQPIVEPEARTKGRGWGLLLIAWLVALAVSVPLDASVATWMRESGIDKAVKSHRTLAEIVKLSGNYMYVALPAAMLIGWLHASRWLGAVLLVLSGFTGIVNSVLKWVIGRTRPFKLPEDIAQPAPYILDCFRGGLRGLFQQSNLCFPSGHACTTFATMTALAILLPRWRVFFYAVATAVAVERVLENAHYLSDVVGGAGLGFFGVQLLRHWCDQRIDAGRSSRENA